MNSGVEIAGGFQYANPVSGLGLEFRAFALPVYSDEDYYESGFSLSVSASPGIGGEGLAMLMAASMGPDTGGAQDLLRRKVFEPLDPANSLADALSVNTEVGYGFPPRRVANGPDAVRRPAAVRQRHAAAADRHALGPDGFCRAMESGACRRTTRE